MCFVPLLPPKDAQTDPTDPLGLQLAHIPPPASVVALAELLVHKPAHPVECIGTALARLAPTCRSLWDTPWITEKRAKVLSGDEESVGEVHLPPPVSSITNSCTVPALPSLARRSSRYSQLEGLFGRKICMLWDAEATT